MIVPLSALLLFLCLPFCAASECNDDLTSLNTRLEGEALADRIRDIAAFELNELQDSKKPASARAGLQEDLNEKVVLTAKLSGLTEDAIRQQILEVKRELVFGARATTADPDPGLVAEHKQLRDAGSFFDHYEEEQILSDPAYITSVATECCEGR